MTVKPGQKTKFSETVQKTNVNFLRSYRVFRHCRIALFRLDHLWLADELEKTTMKKRLLVLAFHLAASGADAYFTNRNQHLRTHSELSPIARPFVSNGQPLLIAYFAATFGIETIGEYELNKHHHERLAFGLATFNIAEHATGAAISAHGYKP